MTRALKNMSIIYKVLIPLCCIIIIAGVVSYVAMGRIVTHLIDDMVVRTVDGKIKDVEINIQRMSREALDLASTLSALPEVKKIYRMKEEAAARDAMRAFFTPLAEKIKKDTGASAVNVHFHYPPAKSLLRTWRQKGKKDGGDDLASFRSTILQVSKTKKPVLGIEVGRGGFVVRGLAPIFDGDDYLGSRGDVL